MLKKPFSQKLKCAYMGITLGLTASIVYMTFLVAHQAKTPDQMILIPISTVVTATSSN